MFDPFKVYGFDYVFNGRRFTFTVDAQSDAEAKAMAAAMRNSAFVGELKPVDPSCMLPQSDDSAVRPVTAL